MVFGEETMSETTKFGIGKTEHKAIAPQVPISGMELRDYKKVVNNLMQDALDVWADAWAELDGHRPPGSKETEGSGRKVEPSCGWTEYLEKMWILRHYLEFTKKFSQP